MISNASTGRWLHREIRRLMCCVGDNEGEKWTPRILAQSVLSMSGNTGGDFGANECGKKLFP